MKNMKISKFLIVLAALTCLAAFAHDSPKNANAYENDCYIGMEYFDRLIEVRDKIQEAELKYNEFGTAYAKKLFRKAGFPECSIDKVTQDTFIIFHDLEIKFKPLKDAIEAKANVPL